MSVEVSRIGPNHLMQGIEENIQKMIWTCFEGDENFHKLKINDKADVPISN